ncbi:MAG: hypothetical protein HQ567_26225 [Candidatus Nealsonbacteria bacterium]|nr:hypothetical protein [Candidatus Nealsonbacteria bacterium]
MDQYVEITFECVPLRSLGRLDVPLDAPAEFAAKIERVKRAVGKHGQHNAYYLHDALCIFHLTNNPNLGMLEFAFEGTALTALDDCSTRHCDWVVFDRQ